MDVKGLMKEWRIWVLLAALLVATLWISPSYDQRDGQTVLTTNLENRTGIDFSGGTRLLLEVQTNQTGSDLEDLTGDIRDTLALRVSSAGVDAKIRTVDIGNEEYRLQVETSNTNQTQLRSLIQQEGSFEARMPVYAEDQQNITVDYSDPTVVRFTRHNTTVTAEEFDNGWDFNGNYTEGEDFRAGNTKFIYQNVSEERAELEAVAYNGTNILSVNWGDRRTEGSGSSFTTRFPVELYSEPANDAGQIFSNYVGLGGQLEHDNGDPALLRLYVDGQIRNSLTVDSSLGETPYNTQSSISAGGESSAEARNSAEELKTILESGRLEAPVEIVSISSVSAALGSQFMAASILSIVGSLVAVGLLIFVRYHDPRYAIPIVLTGASEVYILLGFWSWFTQLGSLTLSAIAGIIAAVGTGVDDQIIITDESDREVVRSMGQRMKRAFFVIFTSAASTIGAMYPILDMGTAGTMVGIAGAGLIGYSLYSRKTNHTYLAVGVMALLVAFVSSSIGLSSGALQTIHGFAATTILGIMIGITITRPAYAKTVEYIQEDQ